MTKRLLAILGAAALLAATLLGAQAGAATSPRYAPLDRPGPKLDVPTAKLRAALTCHGRLAGSTKEPVLLSPGTGVTPAQNFSWNYERAFDAQHRPWCAVTMPFHTLGDIQTAAEYLVYGVRYMHAHAHRPIAIVGHSQGGMSMRWSLRFWPDIRPMVGDVIGLAGDNHGTTTVLAACRAGLTKCVPADWQQAANSKFIAALNSRSETVGHVDYTEIYSHTDEVVQPDNDDAYATSALIPGPHVTNVATQSICRTDVDEHLLIGTIDPVAYALVIDALDHPGPAKPSRISRSVCTKLYQPGVNPANAPMYVQLLAAAPGLLSVPLPDVNLVGAPEVSAEPKLRCYVFAAGC